MVIPLFSYSMDIGERRNFISSLIQGDQFKNDKKEYALIPGLNAVNTGRNSKKASGVFKTLTANNDILVQNVVQTKGGFTIFEPQSSSGLPMIKTLRSSSSGASVYPVMLNLQTKTLGVFTGKLWLKLKDVSQAENITKDYPLKLDFSNTSMETAFYTVSSGEDILKLKDKLENDARVLRVTLDIFEKQKSWR